MSSVSIEPGDNGFVVAGELNVRTVPGLLPQAQALFLSNSGDINVDLQKVTRADSSGIAILIEWMRTARDNQRQIRFYNVPEQLMAIAKVCDLDQVLPIQK